MPSRERGGSFVAHLSAATRGRFCRIRFRSSGYDYFLTSWGGGSPEQQAGGVNYRTMQSRFAAAKAWSAGFRPALGEDSTPPPGSGRGCKFGLITSARLRLPWPSRPFCTGSWTACAASCRGVPWHRLPWSIPAMPRSAASRSFWPPAPLSPPVRKPARCSAQTLNSSEARKQRRSRVRGWIGSSWGYLGLKRRARSTRHAEPRMNEAAGQRFAGWIFYVPGRG